MSWPHPRSLLDRPGGHVARRGRVAIVVVTIAVALVGGGSLGDPVGSLRGGAVDAGGAQGQEVTTSPTAPRSTTATSESTTAATTTPMPGPTPTPAPGATTGITGVGVASSPGVTQLAGGDEFSTVVSFPPTLATSWPPPPNGTARAILAIDNATGQVVASDQEDLRLAVASTIKLVTALTTRRLMPLDRMITAGPEADLGGSTAAIEPGDTWAVQDLLLGLLLRSGNDAAEVLAVADGDRSAFIDEMNTTVEALGIQGATVTDPSGLEDTNLLSARDLATIAQAVLDDEVLAEMVALDAASLPATGVVPNRNLLLQRLDNAIGIKTGTTDLAGASLVGAAVWRDRVVTTVVLATVNDDARYDETEALMRFVDDIGTVSVEVGSRIRVPGAWVGERSQLTLWSPEQVTVGTDVAVDGAVTATQVRLGDQEIASAVMTVAPDAVATGRGGQPGMGQAAAVTVYDALRQAVAVGLVPTEGAGG